MALVTQEYANSERLVDAFSQQIAEILTQAITDKGSASIAVSGGSTPKPLFQALSKIDLPWSQVNITLADERWVDALDDASNEKLVRENLLVNHARAARFMSMTTDDANAEDAVDEISARLEALGLPLDILILGMGEDGHTASLFPCSAQIEEGINLARTQPVLATQPTTAPHQRMSLSLAEIVKSKHVFLHITGDKKRQVLTQAISEHTPLEKPIKAVCDNTTLNLVWAP
ncbi:6-phosphogluconolactonase [Glaciecola siphonariae]|uniref:6-phosphogluconolactonase n=1 Tax=Glaciecola siphonariae TaxID=521012 RepID=A0ABV9LV00_9ALTE